MNFEGGMFNLLSPTGQSLYKLGMGGRIPLLEGRWWSMITANYLHANILHIAFNMLWLSRIGPLVVELYGSSRFWIIYTIAGLTGSIVTTLAGTPFFIGASGAIFGLFGALIYYGRHRGGTFGSAIFRQMLIWAAIAFVFGFINTNIDNWGHFGGFIGGILAALIVGYQERFRQSLYHHLAATILLLFVVICFVFMVIAFFSS
jgi:rhomboid protease GluP